MTIEMDDTYELDEEIESVKCIYPELEVVGFRKCAISLPVQLQEVMELETVDDKGSHRAEIKHLPPIRMEMEFPEMYPHEEAPIVRLDNVSAWLNADVVRVVKEELYQLWVDFRDASIFSYIDYVKSGSEVAFGERLKVSVDRETFGLLVAANVRGEQVIFDNETFMCEICQNEEKGIDCTMFECGDTFCNKCLVGYFTHIIERGEVENVHCPSVKCTKDYSERLKRLAEEAEKGEIIDFKKYDRLFFETPIDENVLRRFLPIEECDRLIDRYFKLFHRNAIERYREFFPNRVSECPRSLCGKAFIREEIESRLAICPRCKFAYCNDCYHSWHGEMNSCSIYMKRIPNEVMDKWIKHNGMKPKEQSKEDKEVCSNIVFKYGRKIIELAVNGYIAEQQFEELVKSGTADIIQCPSCSTFIQRSDGCNKMTCSRCQVFFCNLCGERLNRADPYEHYNNPMGRCFGRLFEGMVIDGEAQPLID